jgi:hypothetical protein
LEFYNIKVLSFSHYPYVSGKNVKKLEVSQCPRSPYQTTFGERGIPQRVVLEMVKVVNRR